MQINLWSGLFVVAYTCIYYIYRYMRWHRWACVVLDLPTAATMPLSSSIVYRTWSPTLYDCCCRSLLNFLCGTFVSGPPIPWRIDAVAVLLHTVTRCMGMGCWLHTCARVDGQTGRHGHIWRSTKQVHHTECRVSTNWMCATNQVRLPIFAAALRIWWWQ